MVFNNFFANLNSAIRKNLIFVEIPFTNKIFNVLSILRTEGFINNFRVSQNKIFVFLKYFNKRPVLKQINCISKKSRKVFSRFNEFLILHKNLEKFFKKHSNHCLIIQTSKGLVSDKTARRLGLGGKLIAVAFS